MKKTSLFLIVAAIVTGNLAAQNPQAQSLRGDEMMKSEKQFSEQPVNNANAIINKERAGVTLLPNVINKDGSNIEQDVKNNAQYANYPHKTLNQKPNPEINSGRNFEPGTPKSSVTVKKTGKEDVATVTFKVIGDPVGNGYGFHMILDATATMFGEYIVFLYEPDLYDACEYKIPENANCVYTDPNNLNDLLNDEISIDIPAGIYDFAFFSFTPSFFGMQSIFCKIYCNGIKQSTLKYGMNNLGEYTYDIDDFFNDIEFKAGFEYIFTAEYNNIIDFYSEYEISLTEIILPPFSSELNDQEEVKVVIKNTGFQDIDEIELSYRINGGDWTEPEIFSANLSPQEEITFTFITQADFSEGGLYKVEVKADYPLDLWTANNRIIGYTKNIYPRELPFFEDFYSTDCLIENWTIINKPIDSTPYRWGWNVFNQSADGSPGEMQVGTYGVYIPIPTPGDDYLITDQFIFPEAGTYNISFYAYAWNDYIEENIRILYGTSSNPSEMEVLEEFIITNTDWDDGFYIKNFEIDTPGNYYFAFHYCTPAIFNAGMVFDHVRIAAGAFVGVPDIMANKVLTPFSSCEMNMEVIGAELYNRGTEPISEFTLTYQINDEMPVTQTFNKTIGLKESVTVYFDQQADLSAIGEYKIKITASTPNEENLDNNENETTIKHFTPLTVLPFISDFTNEDDSKNWIGDGWDHWGGFYNTIPYDDVEKTALFSRCITLEPDIYRIKFSYNAGNIWAGACDFYVAYGKSGVNPYSFEPLKLYYDILTNFEIVEDYILIDIAEEGEYVFAFVAVKFDSGIGISSTTIEVAPEHDFRISDFSASFMPRLTPVYQVIGENTFSVTMENLGATANENGVIKFSLDNNDIYSQNFAFTKLGEKMNVEIKPIFGSIPTGNMNLKVNASNNYGISSDIEMIKIVSDSVYAWDNIDEYFYNGIGNGGNPAGIGLIYELQKPDYLTSVTIGFFEWEPLAHKNFILAVYPVLQFTDEFIEFAEPLFEIEYPRTIGNNMEGITFSVPKTYLQPGKYFFEVRQLDGDLIGIAYDDERGGYAYFHLPQFEYFGKETRFGFIHLRPNFGNPPTGIDELRIKNFELRIYPNPVVNGELRVENGELRMEKITIFNATGQVVMAVSDVNDNSFSINTEKLSAGLYFISVQTENGVINEKIVVK